MNVESTAPPLVSADRLAAAMADPELVILDGSWYLPSSQRTAEEEYRAAHIPRAIRFDIELASDPASALPHALPAPEYFARLCEGIGIGPQSRVVVYDGSATNLSAARVWWLFRVFQHRTISVLDGGFRSWASATRPVQAGIHRRPPTGYPVPTRDDSLVVDRATIDRVVAGDTAGQIVDCRSRERFAGEVDEPRPGLRRGHIPGSTNLPYGDLTNRETGLFFKPPVLRELLAARGIDIARPIIASCGSGVSACVLALAVEVIRHADPLGVGPPVAVYDGSWAEYGR